jgi:twitching motility protein PilJ
MFGLREWFFKNKKENPSQKNNRQKLVYYYRYGRFIVRRCLRLVMRLMRFLLRIQTLLAIGLSALLVFAWLSIQEIVSWQNHTNVVDIFSEMAVSSQRLGKNAPQTLVGDAKAAMEIKEGIDSFDRALGILLRGGEWGGRYVAPLSQSYHGTIMEIKDDWDVVRRNSYDLLEKQKSLQVLGSIIGHFSQEESMQEMLEALSRAYQQDNLMVEAIYVYRLSMLNQRIGRNASILLNGSTVDQEAAFGLVRDIRQFSRILNGLRNGDETLNLRSSQNIQVLETLSEVDQIFTEMNVWLSQQTDEAMNLVQVKKAERTVFEKTEKLRTSTMGVQSTYIREASKRPGYAGLIAAFVLLILSGGGASYFLVAENRRRMKDAIERNKQINMAVHQLISEMQSISTGDLSMRSSTAYLHTQKIAMALNQTLQDVCKLVVRVRMAADTVIQTSIKTQASASNFQGVAHRQVQDTFNLSQNIATMAHQNRETVKKMSVAVLDAQQARESSTAGIETIRQAVGGMLLLRDQIHATSRRIKKLGEASQQIGESVHMMGDITEETNHIALNAAIQASSQQGQSGIGGLAQKIQHLADRSVRVSQVTKHHVEQIQLDTRETMKAMEECLAGVLRGASYSEEALERLEEITQASDRLMTTIELFAQSTQGQVDMSEEVMAKMRMNLLSSQNMLASTREINLLIRQLTYLAEQLIVAVSKFRVK